MHEKYRAWITSHVPENCHNKCAKYAEQMAEAFPELTRVRGHYYCSVQGERRHWWLVSEDGHIVDPTASQFPSKGTGEYKIWPGATEEPTGTCVYCGNDCYRGRQLCDELCARKYINAPI